MRHVLLLSPALFILAVGGCAKPEPNRQQLHLFVPCGMLIPFREVKQAFTAQTGVEVDIVYENMVNLLKLIRRGDRPDVLVTPGIVEMDRMVEEGYVERAAVSVFGSYKLVLVVPGRNKAGVESVQDLLKPSVKQIAIADPIQNSVGYYAEQALKNLGLFDGVKHKLVGHWHAIQAVKYVLEEMVDAGIYYGSCPFESAPDKLGDGRLPYRVLGDIPKDAYPKIRIQAGLLRDAPNAEAGRRFIEFLLQPETQRVLAENGLPNYE